MNKPLELNHHTVLFGQQFSFTNEKTLQDVTEVASECETVQELKSLLNAGGKSFIVQRIVPLFSHENYSNL